MTRDEALKIWNSSWDGVTMIDRFAALGMIKLDEPKSKIDKFFIALGERKGSVYPHDLSHMMDEFGVRIVEK